MKSLEARGGIEPPNKGFADLCLTTWLPRRIHFETYHTLKAVIERVRDRVFGASTYRLTEALFLRFLGVVYFVAFASLSTQILGLAGSHGIEPAARLLDAVSAQAGGSAFGLLPTLFWFSRSDSSLVILCVLGCVFGALLAFNIFSRAASVLCFVLYLSISVVGEPFTSFQWDALLLEAGFLAIFAGAPLLVWAYRLLLFRLMFESGWVKLASGDPNWRNLHALRFHFMTQPLPNPVAYYAYHLPGRLLDTFTALTLAIELFAPVLLFFPAKVRKIGVALLMLLQVLILLTGNYAFFNLLALALCLWGLDDEAFAPLERMLRWRFPRAIPVNLRVFHEIGSAATALLLVLGGIQLVDQLSSSRALSHALAFLQPYEIVNSYGLFAVMTTTRPEIILEGSNDQVEWREYQFPYKPGNTHRGLPWVAPYQPRLDWQMWFAALGNYPGNPWVGNLIYRILTGEPSVMKLLGPPPFPSPPRYVRAVLYSYDFTTEDERIKTGATWQRKQVGMWFGPVSLRGQ